MKAQLTKEFSLTQLSPGSFPFLLYVNEFQYSIWPITIMYLSYFQVEQSDGYGGHTKQSKISGEYAIVTSAEKKLPESPIKFFLGTSSRGDINGQKKFLEINKPVLVAVKGAEDMLTKFLGIP